MSAVTAVENLVVSRVFAAPIQRVYEAWTQAEVLAQWFGPEGFKVVEAECDVAVGGRYEMLIQSPDNNTIKHFGEYVEINAPERLVFTWVLEDQACQGSQDQHATTLVTLDFKTVDNGTSLTLTHEKLPDQAAYNGHKFGWESSFEALATLLA